MQLLDKRTIIRTLVIMLRNRFLNRLYTLGLDNEDIASIIAGGINLEYIQFLYPEYWETEFIDI